MIAYCINCDNMLGVKFWVDHYVYECDFCPLRSELHNATKLTQFNRLKEFEEALDVQATWKNAQTANETCPVCEHDKAYFLEIQTRSADEPATIYYRCCQCNHVWKSD